MIIIHWDFTTGDELSFIEGCNCNSDFQTNVLDFFCWDYLVCFDLQGNVIQKRDDIIVLKENGDYISLKTIYNHTDKNVKYTHNVTKMLVANGFQWRNDFYKNYDYVHKGASYKPQWDNWS